jgi:hypothetical protein
MNFATHYDPLDKTWWFPGNKETVEDRQDRYSSIERDMIEVVFDENEDPLYPGPTGRLQTLIDMNAIADHESGYRLDVDLGVGKYARGDHGTSVCLMQVNLDKGFVHVGSEVWSDKDLLSDRKKCFRAGLARMKESRKKCSYNPGWAQYAAYASGSCKRGWNAAKAIWYRSSTWFNQHTPDFDDQDVLDALAIERSNVSVKFVE